MVRDRNNPLQSLTIASAGALIASSGNTEQPLSLGVSSSSGIFSQQSIQETYASLFILSEEVDPSNLFKRTLQSYDFSQFPMTYESSGTVSAEGEAPETARQQMNRYIRLYDEIIDVMPVSTVRTRMMKSAHSIRVRNSSFNATSRSGFNATRSEKNSKRLFCSGQRIWL
jgi:hypothetical protein